MRILALWLVLCFVCRADFQSGLAAYEKGDYAGALREWQPLADKGDANAQYNIGLLHARGQGVPQDAAKAAEWYRKAAEQGVAAAQYNLGVMYANGQGVPASAHEARTWFAKAAEQGVGEAAAGLGNIYREQTELRNFAEAEKWYRKAASEGVASAAFQLGIVYDLGQGVERNFVEAMKWYRQAADMGYSGALVNIGILYYNAQGVERDLVQAYAWFARGQKAGDPRAEQMVRIAASKMKPKEIERARAAVGEWQPKQKERTEAADARLFKQPASPAQPAPGAGQRGEAVMQAAAAREKPSIRHTFTNVARVVAVGDLHGDYEQFVLALESAGLVDGNADWTGGKTHLVQTGDVLDRGPDSRRILDLLMKLERQAGSAGGAVHALLGNHEAMNLYGDLRFVSPGEFAAFRPSESDRADREIAYPRSRALTAPARPESDRTRWTFENPPGFAGHRAAFGPEGLYGKWLRARNAAVKIDRTLYIHAGLGPRYAAWPLERINNQVRAELEDLTRLHGGIVLDENGPLWFSGLARGDERELQPLVDGLLRNFGVDRIVIGHTYADAAITPRFGGKVVLIDIGLSRVYDGVGKLGVLLVEDGKAWALHRGQKLDLPDSAAGMLPYLKRAAVLDPQPSPLAPRIAKLEASLR